MYGLCRKRPSIFPGYFSNMWPWGGSRPGGVGSEVLVGVLVGVLVLVVVLVELEGQGPGRAPCSHHLRATLGIQVA